MSNQRSTAQHRATRHRARHAVARPAGRAVSVAGAVTVGAVVTGIVSGVGPRVADVSCNEVGTRAAIARICAGDALPAPARHAPSGSGVVAAGTAGSGSKIEGLQALLDPAQGVAVGAKAAAPLRSRAPAVKPPPSAPPAARTGVVPSRPVSRSHQIGPVSVGPVSTPAGTDRGASGGASGGGISRARLDDPWWLPVVARPVPPVAAPRNVVQHPSAPRPAAQVVRAKPLTVKPSTVKPSTVRPLAGALAIAARLSAVAWSAGPVSVAASHSAPAGAVGVAVRVEPLASGGVRAWVVTQAGGRPLPSYICAAASSGTNPDTRRVRRAAAPKSVTVGGGSR
jgi:hypothetical protein